MPQKPKSSKPRKKGFTLRNVAEAPAAATPEGSPSTRKAFDNLGELPHGYGEDIIFLIAQEPHWLFTYWDIDIAKHPGGAAFLRYHRGNGEIEGEIEVPFETRNWYIPVQQASTDYYVEIGFYRAKKWNLIARSVTVTTPSEKMASSEDFDYATIPFHLSFQRLIDNLESAVLSGEDLLSAVSRLQQQGDFSAFGGVDFSDLLSEDQRVILRLLLGTELADELSSGGLSSGDIESRLRTHLAEHLGSGAGASELLSSFRDTAELLSSGAFSSETTMASWSGAAMTSWSAAALTSWSGAALASWASALGSSWTETAFAKGIQAALASWSQAAVTSWTIGGESSGSLTTMSSWLQGIQSSWAQAALSSWTSSEVSSWFSASATSSWSGASEGLSSFGESSSSMGVIPEAVIYVNSASGAQVTIDGHPATLNPDGTFSYHFPFAEKDCRISITTGSPGSGGQRSATLELHRTT